MVIFHYRVLQNVVLPTQPSLKMKVLICQLDKHLNNFPIPINVLYSLFIFINHPYN